MTFDALLEFVTNGMRMSHVYQPVMIRTLLESGGSCSVDRITKALLLHDRGQIEYYTQITHYMVGRVLRNRGVVERDGKSYRLIGAAEWSKEQRAELRAVCDRRLAEYIDKRGDQIWQHRRKSAGYITGTLRYEVLKEAKFRCTLCGVSADVRALEVDHIVPRKRGGVDDRPNLQALCYQCNAMKRDTDSTDFRLVRDSYSQRDPGCPFCKVPKARIVSTNELAYAIRDLCPVTPHHHLVIPKRHVDSYFDLVPGELNAINLLVKEVRKKVLKRDESVAGFNVGVNGGISAGHPLNTAMCM
jgi:5-methylcytosine-specific restriction endonuclease McrA